jgi:uncharacterized NAD-dependent epimerase/dehydratase family protein
MYPSSPSPSRLGAPERPSSQRQPTAVVYCEGNFGRIDGKTANGLVRHSERFRIVSVVDSEHAGSDAGLVLGDGPNGIPVIAGLEAALGVPGGRPDWFVFGMAPSSGLLSPEQREVVLRAMSLGMSVVNGLHEFLNDDPEFAAAAILGGVEILDVRRPADKKDLHMFTGRIDSVTCPRIAVLGTDGAIGKRTTATVLAAALEAAGLRTVLVGTGQTSLIQGARYGAALDAVPAQFCAGEVEHAVVEAFEQERPDVMVIEGQGALSHPAYLTSVYILRGSRPQGVILQHAPRRRRLSDFPTMQAPTAASEIHLIETFADTRVIGVTLNHENMSVAEVDLAVDEYRAELGVPVTDALLRPPRELVDMVVAAFPALEEQLTAVV